MVESGREYSLAETFALVLVLADVPIILIAVLVGPVYAVALAAILVIGGLLAWYLTRRFEAAETGDADETAVDPVTELQRRYAAGELSEAEFERKLDRLVESEERADRENGDTEELSLDTE